ncbi:YjbF family lipoprotein [Antarctobacter jejuensis]|uniref:YjbF family lipoprotein n=1 Tax=Antarctobacter jejuensis TaxID=1439938 RepID=UPI003FD2EC74
MTRRILTRIGLALSVALSLSACGTANDDSTDVLRDLPKAIFGKKQEPQPVSPQLMAQALAATKAPVFLYALESRQAQIMLAEIQRNGPYQTFGNSARQVIVMRQGMITSTRGLGGDLMSSEEDQLLSYVANRAEGQVSYDLRFLTPEDVTLVRRYSCRVARGDTIPVAAGLVQTTARVVTVFCVAGDGVSPDFVNTYAVASDGYILSSKQWMGPFMGYVLTQVLRR